MRIAGSSLGIGVLYTALLRYTDGPLKWIIDHGISPSGIPAAKGLLEDEEIWLIFNCIRYLPAKGILGEPEANTK
jgi:hypothetical protein